MNIRMEDDEREFFSAFVKKARSYAEFGAGGSTVFAASLINGPIFAVDSSAEWLEKVRATSVLASKATELKLLHVDIGPIGAWGAPVGETHRHLWPKYATSIWRIDGSSRVDLYFIDGRFRISCAVESILRCRPDSVILMHDFAERRDYHIVKEVAREISAVRSLSAFVRRNDFNISRALEILELKKFEWN